MSGVSLCKYFFYYGFTFDRSPRSVSYWSLPLVERRVGVDSVSVVTRKVLSFPFLSDLGFVPLCDTTWGRVSCPVCPCRKIHTGRRCGPGVSLHLSFFVIVPLKSRGACYSLVKRFFLFYVLLLCVCQNFKYKEIFLLKCIRILSSEA